PIGMATAFGWIDDDTYAGNSTAPWGDATRTTSPFVMPCVLANAFGTSTQASHAACVIVSGTSWSHELAALRPSKNRKDGYASSDRPAAAPSALADSATTGAIFGVTAIAGVSRHTPPCCNAAVHCPFTVGSHAAFRNGSNVPHGSGPLPSSLIPSTVRPIVSITSPKGRASRIGAMVGCMRPTTPSRAA